jgi:hypothetical protein
MNTDAVERARAVSIESELVRRGVRLRRHGKELIGPCPRCGGDDRFAVNPQRQIWNCRNCKPNTITGDIIGLSMWLDGCGFAQAIQTLTGDSPRPTAPAPASNAQTPDEYEREQHRKASWLWSLRQPVGCTLAERYLREARGYTGPIPPTLAFLPARKPKHYPALISAFAVTDESEPAMLGVPRDVRSVHLTLLAGCKKAPIEHPKLIIGSPKQMKADGTEVSTPIVLAPVNDLLGLAITEGVEDGLTVASLGLGVWAAGSAGFMPALAGVVPSYVDCITIFAHPDQAGQHGARSLARKLHRKGIEVFIEGIAHG